MSGNEFAYPSQFKVSEISIDGEDVTALFLTLEVFENIFIPAVSGSFQFMDVDGAGFVEDNKIEFNEPFKFSIEATNGEKITFDGHLNGLATEGTSGEKKIYTVDFTTEHMRTNEKTFISQKYDLSPGEVVSEMIQKVEGTLESDASGSQGEKLEFVATRWKPFKVINYVLQRGVSGDSEATKTETGEPKEEEAKGSTGFLCWQTIGEGNPYRFCSVKEMLDGAFDEHTEFENKLMNRSLSMEECNKAILQYDFKEMGDIQTKMKSGAFFNKTISFDMDTGEYKEFIFDGTKESELMTEKQKEIVDAFTRILYKPFQNDKFSKDCQKAPDNTGDQSRKALSQNTSQQNSFNDQTGEVTMYAQFQMHAGDIIDLKINKVKAPESDGRQNQKHSGKYVIKQVGHHFTAENMAYTKIKTIRSTNQVDRSSAK